MKTFKAWQESDSRSLDDFVGPYDEIDEEMYWYFMEILPPYYCESGFMVSEPYSYCEKYNTSTYGCYINLGDKYYYLGNISPKAVNDELATLKEKIA